MLLAEPEEALVVVVVEGPAVTATFAGALLDGNCTCPAAAEEMNAASSVGNGTSPFTCQPPLALGHGGAEALGLYAADETLDGLKVFHWF